jgi:hypothetical protein
VKPRLKLLTAGGCVLFFGMVLLNVGCGSSSTKLRVMNAAPDQTSLDVLIDNKNVATNINYGTASSYVKVSAGSRNLQIEPSGTTTPIINSTITVNSGNTTLIAANFTASIATITLSDSTTAPTTGDVQLRIVNAAPGLGTGDVYIVAPGTDLTTVSPTIASLAFQSASSYQQIAAGSYEVFFTLPNQKFAYIDSGPLTLAAGQNRTIVGLNSQSGGFTTATLADLN